jgi:hypothetical protein
MYTLPLSLLQIEGVFKTYNQALIETKLPYSGEMAATSHAVLESKKSTFSGYAFWACGWEV